MGKILTTNLIVAVVVFSLIVARANGNPCTMPAMVLAGLAFVFAILGLAQPNRKPLYGQISSLALILLIWAFSHATSNWPKGDDGGGFGWLFIVGSASVISFIVGLLMLLASRDYSKKEKQSAKKDSVHASLKQARRG